MVKKRTKKLNINRLLVVIGLALLAITIVSVLGIRDGYFKYGYAYVKCGGEPVAVSYHFAENEVDYYLPGDTSYPGAHPYMKYVCSENEAIGLGAKHVPVDIDQLGN